jgi:hypothetical protein
MGRLLTGALPTRMSALNACSIVAEIGLRRKDELFIEPSICELARNVSLVFAVDDVAPVICVVSVALDESSSALSLRTLRAGSDSGGGGGRLFSTWSFGC